ncbi:exonuclease domain-containing protein [Salinibacterium hongtaonis]|uniref:exonuclease domain-containing protein n=1 Tax=Homoserinimonas hongtaonis TaxID=2079791 RepID=UPI000D380C16|nr:exonuclease domain-containing protein [Salinibacterium hongtaonis]AWB89679.1 DNA polymerase III subunit epsilon [Salinibacterium hongtaonis]
MSGPGFAVIDFETTGLFPGGHDRVVEVAVVHVSPDGAIEGQWDTLVNPMRDLGPQHVHRIRAADVMSAPTFEQIAPKLVELLAGRVVVAHNASFDLRFLEAELDRASVWGMPKISSLCTMQLARDFLPGAGRSLSDCCDALDIVLDDAHRASADALATAQLLAAYLGSSDDREGWNSIISEAHAAQWPVLKDAGIAWCPRENAPSQGAETAATFLARITLKMPEYAGPAECLDYLALLDRCLLDRHFSAHEAQGLVALAERLGLSRDTCANLHIDYFQQLVRVAWADGVLTDDEIADLMLVADLLDVRTSIVEDALAGAGAVLSAPEDTGISVQFSLAPGDLIVLTGDMIRPRSEWESHLLGLGYKPHGAVTKKVRLVAAADPDSLSGKARKARDYGIPIVDEAWLVKLLG